MADITQLMNVLGGASGATGDLKKQLGVAVGSMKEAISAGGAAEQQAVMNAGTIASQTYRGELNAQEDGRRAATSLGTNMSDDAQIVTQLGAVMKQSALNVIAQAKKVNQTASRSDMFGNPAGFMYDLLYGDAERGALEAAEDQFDAAAKVMQGLNTATQQNVASQNAIAQTKSEAGFVAQQELVANEALIKANAAKERLAGADMAFINQMDSLNARQVQLATSAYQVQAQAEQQAWMRADRLAMRAEKAKDKAAEAQIVAQYNAGAVPFGGATVGSLAELNTARSINKPKVDYFLTRGAELTHTGSYRLASNPLETLRAVQDFNLKLNPKQAQIGKLFQNQLGTAVTTASIEQLFKDQGMDPKSITTAALQAAGDKKQWPTLQRDWLARKALVDAEVINVGDSSNIYAPPALEFLAGKSELDENMFLSKYIKPIAAAGGGAVFDPSRFMEFAAKAAIEDKISVSEITAGITWMADQAVLSNNTVVGYHKTFGVDPQKSLVMPTVIEGGDMFGDSVQNTNLRDSTAVTSRILDAIAAEKKTFKIPSLSEMNGATLIRKMFE